MLYFLYYILRILETLISTADFGAVSKAIFNNTEERRSLKLI